MGDAVGLFGKNRPKRQLLRYMTDIILTENQFNFLRKAIKDGDNEPILEFARVGFAGKFEIYIMTNDPGSVPHFHIRDAATQGDEFETCIRIDTNQYFFHGKYKGVLNSKQRKDLAEFMEGPCKLGKYQNNYELAVDMWNLNNNSDVIIYPKMDENGNIIVPNYREILL